MEQGFLQQIQALESYQDWRRYSVQHRLLEIPPIGWWKRTMRRQGEAF